jgi:hypothetical protein
MARVFQAKANLIQVKEPNFRLANRDMVQRIIQNLGVEIPQKAIDEGLS